MSVYSDFKASVQGTVVGDGQCVALVVNNSRAYIEHLFPGVNWTTIIAPVTGAKDIAGKPNSYLTWIANDHNNPDQLPIQGDIMVFDATPQAGYTNQFNNPYGHTGVCDSADPSGYSLLQQNSPTNGAAANVTRYAWKYRPCLGWYRANTPSTTPPPIPPVATSTSKTIFLPPTTGPWHVYHVGGPYNPAQALGVIVPSQYGGLTYQIVNDRGNGVYTINTQMYGQGDLWTKGSDVVIR